MTRKLPGLVRLSQTSKKNAADVLITAQSSNT